MKKHLEHDVRTHRQCYERAAEMFEEHRTNLARLVETELPQLEEHLEAAGAAWTPGRKLPKNGSVLNAPGEAVARRFRPEPAMRGGEPSSTRGVFGRTSCWPPPAKRSLPSPRRSICAPSR